MKKLILTVSSIVIALSLFASCGRQNVDEYKITTTERMTTASENRTSARGENNTQSTRDENNTQSTSEQVTLSNSAESTSESDMTTSSEEENSSND